MPKIKNTILSVNINKVATLRNARGENVPDVIKFAIDCQKFGAEGITVHPRPDERHITRNDVFNLKKVVYTEFNIEGYPSETFMELVLAVKPDQVTLVPDSPEVLTSNAGWNTVVNLSFLREICNTLTSSGIRASIFVSPDEVMIEGAAEAGASRVELYTKPYADAYKAGLREEAVRPYIKASRTAADLNLGVNAGHDLSLSNLSYFRRMIPFLDEVSIGHALISDALYMGIKDTIQAYLLCLKQ